ncbi:MAG: prepilin-type N-terminal cleavage/methylation domain-containing protein, partial [Planctomycetaceae bacterium]|nr:prepilin-type N-terminal cleavage/methylation domain-containing protein [Planctomycetaceae bacterium]
MRRTSLRPESNNRSGFTLLEVLLTVLLSMILLGGLWSLSNIYLRTFERGQDLVEQAQLLRAIQQQVSDDLQALAVRPKLNRRHSEFMATEEGDVSTEASTSSDPMDTPVTDFSPSYSETSAESGTTSLPVYSLSGNETSMKLIILRDVYTTDKNDEF